MKSTALRRVVPFLFLLPALLLLPGMGEFAYPSPQAPYSDITITHYPNAVFLRRMLLEQHAIPLWSSMILSGYPFGANPLSGLWYPSNWLALILPLPLGFNLLVALHLIWGSYGMYRLLAEESRGTLGALFGGLAFGMMPKLFAHYGAGHLTLVYAVSWTPWLLLASRGSARNLADPNVERVGRVAWLHRRMFRPGVVLAFILLADVRWGAYAGLVWLGYELVRGWGNLRRVVTLLLENVLIAGLLSAPLTLPMMEYVRLSTRMELTPKEMTIYSLPPVRLLGLFFPDFGGFHEWMIYPGVVVLVLGLLALWPGKGVRASSSDSARKRWFWAGLVGFALMLSLGEALPWQGFLGRVPGLDLLRVPARSLFLSGMGLAALASYGVDDLLTQASQHSKRWQMLGLISFSGFILALVVGLRMVTRQVSPEFLWGLGMGLTVSIWAGMRLRDRVPGEIWFVILLALMLTDLIRVDLTLFASRPSEVVFNEKGELASFLAGQEGLFRVYSPSYSLPQHVGAEYGLELADGVDPLQLRAYARFMERATGVPRLGYSVTLPPLANGDPSQDNVGYLPNTRLLGWLNVRYVVAEFDLQGEGLVPVARLGSSRVYENRDYLPRAWVQPAEAEPGQGARPVQDLNVTPNQVSLTAEGPGMVVLSEVMYPGWEVTVDATKAEVQTVAGVLRGVEIGPGRHEAVFSFRLPGLFLGLGFFALGVLGVVMSWGMHRSRSHLS